MTVWWKRSEKKLSEHSDKILQLMRNKFSFAVTEVEEGRWCKFATYDKDSESHDFVGLITHARTFVLDEEEEACLFLMYKLLKSQGFKIRDPEYGNIDLFEIKKAFQGWNDYGATEEQVLVIFDACKTLVEQELKKRHIVFA